MSKVAFQNISKVFPNGYIGLDDVSFSVEPGSFTYIVGESGAGKTTIMRLLIREFDPSQGQIFLGDDDITQLSRRKLPHLRRKVGVVFQDYKLIADKTVYENISVGLEILGVRSKEIREQVGEVLDVVGLPEKAQMFPAQLSGGELQRIAIARALAMTPVVIFADEPTGNLDPETSRGIIELLQKVQSMGTTVFVATHDQTVLNAYPSRQLRMRQGKLVEDTDGEVKPAAELTAVVVEEAPAKSESKPKKAAKKSKEAVAEKEAA